MPTLASIDGRSLALDLSRSLNQLERFGERRREAKTEAENIELAQQARGIGQAVTTQQQERAGGFLRKIAPQFADVLAKLNESRDPDGVDQLRAEAERGRETADQILGAKTQTEKQAIILKRVAEVQKAGGDTRQLLKQSGGTPAEMDLQAQKAQLTSKAALDALPAPTDAERLRARAALSVRDPNALVAIQKDEAVQRQIEAQRRAERRAGAAVSRKQRILDIQNEFQDSIDGVAVSTKSPDTILGDAPADIEPATIPAPTNVPDTVDPALNELLGEPVGRTQADVVSDFNREAAQQDAAPSFTGPVTLPPAEVAALNTPQETIPVEVLSQPIAPPQRGGPAMNVRDAFQDELKAQTFLANARSDDERTAAKNVLANATARREILEEAGAFKGQTDIGKLIADQQEIIARLGPDSIQAKAIGELIQSEQKGARPKLSDIAGLRKEFTAKSKDFITMSNAVKKVNASPESGAGDVALIFNYMKILDPNSVVRESEFATAENTAGLPTRVTQAYNKALTGERLTPEMRGNFKDAANTLFDTAVDTQITDENNFKGVATRLNMNPENVVIDFVSSGARPPPKSFAQDRSVWRALTDEERALWLN